MGMAYFVESYGEYSKLFSKYRHKSGIANKKFQPILKRLKQYSLYRPIEKLKCRQYKCENTLTIIAVLP